MISAKHHQLTQRDTGLLHHAAWLVTRAAVGCRFPREWDGTGPVISPHELMGITCGFLSCEIWWKRFKHGVNAIVDV